MSRGRNIFAITVLFSAIWHFFWIATVNIVVTPSIEIKDEFTNVTFLGPILEKTAFEMMVEEYQPKTETLYRISMLLKTEEHLDVEGPSRALKKDAFKYKTEKKALIARNGNVFKSEDKPHFFNSEKSIFYHIGDKIINRFMEGPAKNRAILFKPNFPYFSKRSLVDEENFVTKFRFTLSNTGNVEVVEPVVSSGYPDIDMRCIQYLKQWKFAPRPMDTERDGQWGIITFNIRLQ